MQAWNNVVVQNYINDDQIELDNFSYFKIKNSGASDVSVGFGVEAKQLLLKPNESEVFPQYSDGVYQGKMYLFFEGSGTKKFTVIAVKQNNVETE